jgi:tryptophan halogenase
MKAKSICIVGGGTSGWLTALAIQKYLPKIELILVESPTQGVIGVGEATVPPVSDFLSNFLELEEVEWMKKTNATYKAAIRFNNFRSIKEYDSIYHPFPTKEELHRVIATSWGLKKRLKAVLPSDYGEHYLATQLSHIGSISKECNLAHHFDSVKLGSFCKDKALKSGGISHIEAHINKVSTKFTEVLINSLELEGGETIEADLFIDCSGFNSILLQKSLKAPFDSFEDALINDRAVVVRVPREEVEHGIPTYTNCTGLSSGWVWEVPLWDREGAGYVYSSKFISDSDASKELLHYLDNRGAKVSALHPKVLKFSPGVVTESWVGNCVGVGLSTGFVEPLESTGLLATTEQIKNLIHLLQYKEGERAVSYGGVSRALYSYDTTSFMNNTKDFILAHYIGTERTDSPYWIAVSKLKVSESLITKIKLAELNRWEEVPDMHSSYASYSWASILLGLAVVDNTQPYGIFLEGEPFESLTSENTEIVSNILGQLHNLKNDAKSRAKMAVSHTKYLKDNLYGNDSNS